MGVIRTSHIVVVIVLAVAIPAGIVGGTPSTTNETLSATVTGMTDSDTVDIEYQNGSTDTVRLLGVDTPEVYGENDPTEFEGIPDTEAGRQCLDAAGEDAS